ncbi:MAG: hypothetical protein RQ757_06140 [Pseudomonadales bacterium]|nr:hypothetical protein [Pseudomonadales bacterium]
MRAARIRGWLESSWRSDILLSVLLLATGLLLHGSVLDGNWRWDDPQILLHAQQYSILHDFIRPEVWQQFSPANLTPWLVLSLEVDLILFGVQTTAFYLHHLLALAAAAIGLYFCLRLWAGRIASAAGGLLFLLGTPSGYVAEQLMTRHYLEGLVFAELALIAFVVFLRTGRGWLLAAGTLCYLLAVTAKEIYVPLLVLLLFLHEGSPRARLRAAVPFVLVALAYVLWRGWMLGSLGGGYTEAGDYIQPGLIQSVLSSFSRFPVLLLGQWGWFYGVVLLVLLLAVIYSKSPGSVVPGTVLALLVLLPLVPLVNWPGIVSPDRYLLLPWVVLSFASAWMADKVGLHWRSMRLPLLGAGLLLFLLCYRYSTEQRALLAVVADEFDVQADFLWQQDEQSAFLPSANVLPTFWFVTGLQQFKREIMPGSTAPRAIVDPVYLGADEQRLYSYQRECHCMQDISASLPERNLAFQTNRRQQAPLSLEFSYQQGIFAWQFGPYEQGSYHVVSDLIGVIPAARTGRLRVTLAEGTPFYVRYTAPEGWVSYSSLQRVQQGAGPVTWER